MNIKLYPISSMYFESLGSIDVNHLFLLPRHRQAPIACWLQGESGSSCSKSWVLSQQ